VAGVGMSALAGIVTGGAGTAVVSGALFAANLEAKRRKLRQGGEIGIGALDMGERGGGYLKNLEWAGENAKSLEEDDLNRALDSMMNRVHNKTEKFITDEQRRRKLRILGGAALGTTVGVVSHNMVPMMDGMFGGDSAQALSPDVASASVDA